MKRIIDIDENYYRGICKIVERFGKGSVVLSTPEKIMFNSTPLEEELEKLKEEKLDLIGCGVNIGSRWSKQNTIEELEKIKAEIDALYGVYDSHFKERVVIKTDVMQILDKHLKELKGENNPDCRYCDKWKTCENGEKGHANGTSIGYLIGECRDYVELKGE